MLRRGTNAAGQLGYGDLTQRNAPGTAIAVGAQAIALGDQHTCVLLPSSAGIICWGYGVDGELGYGDTSSRSSPGAVLTTSGGAFSFVSAGSAHTCAQVGTFGSKCWGINALGCVLFPGV